MKKNISLLIVICFISFSIANCQTDANIITKDQFYAITLNGLSLNELINSEGNLDILNKYFGTPLKSNINEKIGIKGYTFNGFRVGFREGLSGFTLLNDEVTISINDKELKIGDNISLLGENIIFNTDSDGSKSILFQYCEGCNNFIAIDFDQETKLITAIYYIELT